MGFNDAELAQASAERMNGYAYEDPDTDHTGTLLPESAIGETNQHTGHVIIDQIGDVVLGWRFRVGGPDRQPHAEYVTWTLFTTWDGRRGYDAGDYHDGPGALERAVHSLFERSGHTPLGG